MSETLPPPRKRMGVLGWFVLLGIACLVIGVVAVGVLKLRANKRGYECQMNLRSWSLGAHNYYDIYGQLPPSASADGKWSWVMYLNPYFDIDEQNRPSPVDREMHMEQILQWRHPTLLCPSRRTQGQRLGGQFAGGTPTDYVAVSTSDTRKLWGPDTDGMLVVAVKDGRDERSATTLGSVVDGTPYTAMIGEKHMRLEWFGGELDEPAMVAKKGPNSVRFATDRAEPHPLAGSDSADHWAFGSWHWGVTHFAMGDASVRAVSNETELSVLRGMTSRYDGIKYREGASTTDDEPNPLHIADEP